MHALAQTNKCKIEIVTKNSLGLLMRPVWNGACRFVKFIKTKITALENIISCIENINICLHLMKLSGWPAVAADFHESNKSSGLMIRSYYDNLYIHWTLLVIVKDQSCHLLYLNICIKWQTCENLSSILVVEVAR